MTILATEPRARFRDLIAAEWIKVWSLRSTSWSIIGSALILIAMSLGGAFKDYLNWPDYPQGIKDSFVPDWAINDAVGNGFAMITMLAVGALGAAIVAGEYTSGMIRTTFAAVPARRSVMAAKLLVVTAIFAVYGAVVTLVSFFGSQAILDGRGIGISITYPEVGRILLVSALLAPVSALIGMGLATVIRNAAGAIVATVFLQLLLPFLLSKDYAITAAVLNALPLTAWQTLAEFQVGMWTPPWPYPETVTESWIVYAAWPVVAVVVALAAVRRDP